MDKKIVIIGAGPTGLGAAYRLKELGYRPFKIFEKNNFVGGLSASFRDNQGFSWDIGSHVLFSRHESINQLLDKILGQDCVKRVRKAYIWVMDRWVPYPFQNHIRYLPFDKALECLLGLVLAKSKKKNTKNFKEWILATFGQGIAKYFMLPFNFKIWSHPLEDMSYDWIGERISLISLKRVLGNVIFARNDLAWGPNSIFRYPLSGGIGEVFSRFASFVQEHLFLNKEVEKIDTETKEVFFSDGQKEPYDILISTMPLDHLVRKTKATQFFDSVNRLAHNGILAVGIGLKRRFQADKTWVYVPEPQYLFYRFSYFSDYSPHSTPGDGFCSFLCETAYSQYRIQDKNKIVEDTIRSLCQGKFISDNDTVVSTYCMDAPYAYPVPTLDRDKILREVLTYFEKNDIFSRGRFGTWKYELGNMDHCLMQGIEVVNKILNTPLRR